MPFHGNGFKFTSLFLYLPSVWCVSARICPTSLLWLVFEPTPNFHSYKCTGWMHLRVCVCVCVCSRVCLFKCHVLRGAGIGSAQWPFSIPWNKWFPLRKVLFRKTCYFRDSWFQNPVCSREKHQAGGGPGLWRKGGGSGRGVGAGAPDSWVSRLFPLWYNL